MPLFQICNSFQEIGAAVKLVFSCMTKTILQHSVIWKDFFTNTTLISDSGWNQHSVDNWINLLYWFNMLRCLLNPLKSVLGAWPGIALKCTPLPLSSPLDKQPPTFNVATHCCWLPTENLIYMVYFFLPSKWFPWQQDTFPCFDRQLKQCDLFSPASSD